jgi:ComF family protein
MTPVAGLDVVWACFAYAYPISGLIHQGKYRHDVGVLRILGALLAEFADVQDRSPDLLVPVPLAPERLRQRGFNQAHELCRPIARLRGLEIAERLVVRRSGDPPQVGLPASIRRRNVRSAFRVQGRIDGASVVIVDDVMTTGATASSLATSLRAAGAARVSFLSCARA